jgi:hypothetical protein
VASADLAALQRLGQGGWLAGAIYDYAGFYAAAFALGIVFNVANLLVVGTLVFRHSRLHSSVLVRG